MAARVGVECKDYIDVYMVLMVCLGATFAKRQVDAPVRDVASWQRLEVQVYASNSVR